jgi:hypothetical protein
VPLVRTRELPPVEGDLALVERLAEMRGDRVIVVPPAQGGWEVFVGTARSFRQADLLTALHVVARRLDMSHGPTAKRCAYCDAVLHLEHGRLRCRAGCPEGP